MQHVRGREISMIFQDPMTSLNPVLSVRDQLTEGLRYHFGLDAGKAKSSRAGTALRCRNPRPRNSASVSTRTSSRAECGSG